MQSLSRLIKYSTMTMLLTIAPALSAQMRVIRPEKVPTMPKVISTNITHAPSKVLETVAHQEKRKTTLNPRRTKPKVSAPRKAESLPPLEFTATEDSPELIPMLDLTRFIGGRPESHTDILATSAMRTMPLGEMSVGVPECITIFESDPEFLTGAMSNLLEIEARKLDRTYKICTPQAYTKYIGELYGGIEENVTNGNRTDISGYDTRTSRNYRVCMITDGDNLYVTRIIYRPAMERAVTERLLPTLLTAKTTL